MLLTSAQKEWLEAKIGDLLALRNNSEARRLIVKKLLAKTVNFAHKLLEQHRQGNPSSHSARYVKISIRKIRHAESDIRDLLAGTEYAVVVMRRRQHR